MKYRIEVIWNREFHWSFYAESDNINDAVIRAKDIRDSGDGARVKKVQVLESETDKVVWNGISMIII